MWHRQSLFQKGHNEAHDVGNSPRAGWESCLYLKWNLSRSTSKQQRKTATKCVNVQRNSAKTKEQWNGCRANMPSKQ